MWKTLLLWRFINTPLPIDNPFHRLSAIASQKYILNFTRIFKSFFLTFLLMGCSLVGCIGTVAMWIFLIFWGGNFSLLFVILLPFLLFYAYVGGEIAVKIIGALGKIHNSGLADLIRVTHYGDPLGTWFMARLTYQRINWVKIANTAFQYGIVGIVLLWTAVRASSIPIDNISATAITQMVTEIMTLLFTLMIFYLCFVQSVVMGYLVALWGNRLTIDGLSRVAISIGGIVGSQLVLYVVAFFILFGALNNLFFIHTRDILFTLESALFIGVTLGFMQIISFILIIEIQVRVMMRLLARQADLPYAVWRSELGL